MALGRSANATQVTCPTPPPTRPLTSPLTTVFLIFFNPYWFTINKFSKQAAEPAFGGNLQCSVFSFQCPSSPPVHISLNKLSPQPEAGEPARDAAKLLPYALWHGVLSP